MDCTDFMRTCISDDTYAEVPDYSGYPDSGNGCCFVCFFGKDMVSTKYFFTRIFKRDPLLSGMNSPYA